jgi:hypothetical protein
MVPICLELERRIGAPVIDPLLAAQAQAEMLVSLGRKPLRRPASDAQQRVLQAMVSGGAMAPAYGAPEPCGEQCEILAAETPGLAVTA